MPPSAETSIEAVARYIAAREPDRRRRIKALHDWVADRVSYAGERLPSGSAAASESSSRYEAQLQVKWQSATGPLPAPCASAPSLCRPFANASSGASARGSLGFSTDDRSSAEHFVSFHELAESAFTTRRAVCAGYAALMSELGAAIGEDIKVVTGEGHAWNVAQTGAGYELLDVTWDAGSYDGTAFNKKYSTKWLFFAPDVAHRPDDPRSVPGPARLEDEMQSVRVVRREPKPLE